MTEPESTTNRIPGQARDLLRADTPLPVDEERYGFALEAAGVAVWEWDVSRDRILWSESAARLHGVPMDQLPSTWGEYRRLLHEEDRVDLMATSQRLLAAQKEESLEYRILWPDQSVHWLETRGRRLFDPALRDVIVIGLLHDITQRKQAEELNSQMAAIVEASQDAIYSKRLDGTIISWNTGAERMFGLSREEVIGQPGQVIVPDERIDEDLGILSRVAAGKPLQDFATVRKHRDGTLVDVLLSVSPLMTDNGRVTGVSAIARDVTRRKKLEEQLLQSQKMEALGHLAGGIAHDFNNILTVIIGSCDLLNLEMGSDSPGSATVNEIRRSGERAASLVRQLLAFSRRQVMQMTAINLNEIVQEAESMLRRLIGEDVQLELDLESNLHQIRADPSQLHQVIINLVVNARDSLGRGGRVVIATRNGKHLSPPSNNGEDSDSQTSVEGVQLIVADNGHGMTAATRDRLFEPFFTTKEPGQGTGLGLSTVQGIVAQSRGQVFVDSEVGKGTTFRLHFPAFTPLEATGNAG